MHIDKEKNNIIKNDNDANSNEVTGSLRLNGNTVSQLTFQNMFDKSLTGMAFIGKDGMFLNTNNAMSKITGYSQEELKSKTFYEIINKDDAKEGKALTEDLVSGKINSYEIKKRCIHKNKNQIWVRIEKSTVKDQNGKLLFFIVQMQELQSILDLQYEVELANEVLHKTCNIMLDIMEHQNMGIDSMMSSVGEKMGANSIAVFYCNNHHIKTYLWPNEETTILLDAVSEKPQELNAWVRSCTEVYKKKDIPSTLNIILPYMDDTLNPIVLPVPVNAEASCIVIYDFPNEKFNSKQEVRALKALTYLLTSIIHNSKKINELSNSVSNKLGELTRRLQKG